MRPVHVTLDAEAIATGRDLVHRYGPGASLSAVVRRALAMMDEFWAIIGEDEVTRAYECEKFAKFAGTAQRKPLKDEGRAEDGAFDLAAALDEYNAAEAGTEF
jgi:hypothetical protein